MSQAIDVKTRFMQLLQYAPNEVRLAIVTLLPAVKRTLALGYHPIVLGHPLHGWRCLLTFLASLAAMEAEQNVLLRVSSELLAISDHMAPPDEVLKQSAQILVMGLRADFYVCRLRAENGTWSVRYADALHSDRIPIVAPFLDESLRQHPVMRAVLDRRVQYVVSNNLHALSKGGESIDGTIYSEGYRSRLAFVLREHKARPPFGLITLYTRREGGFDSFDEHFLAKYAKIVSLTVGRRVAVTRDTLEKVSGAVSHYGNNALNLARTYAEYCQELAFDIEDSHKSTMCLAQKLCNSLPKNSPNGQLASELVQKLRADDDTKQLCKSLGGITSGIKRMDSVIKSLARSIEKPRILHYVQGQDVLRLDDRDMQEAKISS